MTKDELIKAGYQWFDNCPDTEAQALMVVAALELDGHDAEIIPLGEGDPETGNQLYAVYVKVETDSHARAVKQGERFYLQGVLPKELASFGA